MSIAKWQIGLGFGLIGMTNGCSWTTAHVARMEPVETTYPVSASALYVDNQGHIVGENDYHVVAPFSFTTVVSGERHKETNGPLRLQSDLDRIMAATPGDAMDRVKVEATSWNSGGHFGAAAWKYMGWTFCLLGAPLVGMAGVFQANHERDRAAFWAIGGSTLGLGILSFVLANTLTKAPATLNLKVSGQVVQKKHILPLSPPTPTEVPANPPADSPAP
ncbi:MAG TPA: hypothetical protein PK156_18020 [Polyangium sp.]|nr:hypothetical protein [Polyangium sp.]